MFSRLSSYLIAVVFLIVIFTSLDNNNGVMSQRITCDEECDCLNGESRNAVADQLNFKRLDCDDEGQQDDGFHELMEQLKRVSLETENKANMSKRNAVEKEIAANEETDQQIESKRNAVRQMIDVSEDIGPQMESKRNKVDSMNAGGTNPKILAKRDTRYNDDPSCVTIPTRKTELVCIFVNYCFPITYTEDKVHCNND